VKSYMPLYSEEMEYGKRRENNKVNSIKDSGGVESGKSLDFIGMFQKAGMGHFLAELDSVPEPCYHRATCIESPL
jgi:hypothetical protein